ncbi:MAG: hypothetical protein JO312_04585, partial [Hyphomicrobiales bacterium]|nr:hypothetical protein [Hyphomicrobiales bacterium]
WTAGNGNKPTVVGALTPKLAPVTVNEANVGPTVSPWKLELIERFNPDWRDLYETLNN